MEVVSVKCNEVEVLKVASELGITFYDASYVFLAKVKGVPLITEDKTVCRGYRNR